MASVTFKRTNNIDSVPIVDGQLIFDTSDQKIYLDNGNTREVYGGGSGTDLISNVSDATDNNAFNANATVNLFTRKSSIVDTKAEIQSVTQAGVPLGCKGFNEVIGTGDISALGDGSVTGAILANKSAIDTVSQNLTNCLIYNQTDDWIYIGDEKWKKAFLQSLVFFNADRGYNADTFGRIETVNTFDSGCYAWESGSSYHNGVTIEDNDIVFQTGAAGPTDNNWGVDTTFTASNAIDLTKYDKLYMKGFLHSDGGQTYFNRQTIILYIQLVSKSSGEVITIQQSPNRPRNLNVEWNTDISQYSGEYYLRYHMRTTQSSYNGSYLNAKFEDVHFS